jgi:hypothetical protein
MFEGTGVAVFDATGPVIWASKGTGQPVREEVRIDGNIQAVTKAGSMWYVASSRSGRLTLFVRRDGEDPRELCTLPSADEGGVQLHGWKDRNVLVSNMSSPLEGVALSPSGDTLLTFEEPNIATAGQNYVALPILPVGRGFVQTLADATSDERIILVYGPDGALLRHSRISAAFGLIHSNPEIGLILGLQDFGTPEVIGFRWHWTQLRSPASFLSVQGGMNDATPSDGDLPR